MLGFLLKRGFVTHISGPGSEGSTRVDCGTWMVVRTGSDAGGGRGSEEERRML